VRPIARIPEERGLSRPQGMIQKQNNSGVHVVFNPLVQPTHSTFLEPMQTTDMPHHWHVLKSHSVTSCYILLTHSTLSVVKSNETLHGTPTKSRHRALAKDQRDFQRQRIAVQGWIDRSQPRPSLTALFFGRATHETHDRREAQRRLQGKDGGQHCRGDSSGRGEHD